jgi:hypothetical protein
LRTPKAELLACLAGSYRVNEDVDLREQWLMPHKAALAALLAGKGA